MLLLKGKPLKSVQSLQEFRKIFKIFIDLKFLKQVNLEEFTRPYLEYTAFLFGNVQVHRIHFLYVEKY